MSNGQQLYSIKEAGKILNSSTITMRRMIYRGEVPYVRLGRKIYFSQQQIDEIINRNTVPPSSAMGGKR